MKKIILILFGALFCSNAAFTQEALNGKADSIIGEYLVPDAKNGDSKVRFTKNAAGTFDCQVFWLQKPTDPNTGKPWLDEKNPDKTLRNIRCDRLFITKGLKYNAKKKQWDGAKVYDPTRGISANMTARFNTKGQLEIRGTILGIGETQYWKKLK